MQFTYERRKLQFWLRKTSYLSMDEWNVWLIPKSLRTFTALSFSISFHSRSGCDPVPVIKNDEKINWWFLKGYCLVMNDFPTRSVGHQAPKSNDIIERITMKSMEQFLISLWQAEHRFPRSVNKVCQRIRSGPKGQMKLCNQCCCVRTAAMSVTMHLMQYFLCFTGAQLDQFWCGIKEYWD